MMGGGGGKKGGGGEYYRYYLSLHAGIAQQLDEITQIILGDRAIWTGSITQSKVFNVNKQDLFGGPKREGGVLGGITVLMGEDHQFMPPYLLAKFGDIADLIPSYRGTTTLFFHEAVKAEYDGALLGDMYAVGQDSAFDITTAQTDPFFGNLFNLGNSTATGGGSGFYFQANNPYLRELKVIGSRRAKGLTRKFAEITRAGSVKDTNPAHIIYELQTDRDFGAGLPISRVNVESFELAAQTLFNEGFGLSMKWISQGKVKDMILEVLDHINALLYEDPRSGLSTLKLLRGDYDVDDLPVADYSNCTVTSFQRKQEELVNEIVVTYTNPDTYEEASVTVQDLAGIAAEGGVISTGRNYYGVHKPTLAKTLGERDLRAEGYPLATAEVEFLREFWDIVPGMVVKLDSPDDSDSIIIMRVMKVDDDSNGVGTIKASLVEDVFSLAAAPIFSTPDPIIDYEDDDPEEASHVQAFTMPYTLSVRAGLIVPNTENYPTAHLGILAASSQSGVDFYEIAGNVTGSLGSTDFRVISTGTIVPRGVLADPMVAEVNSTIDLPSISNGTTPTVEHFAIIGSGDDGDMEIAGITATGSGTLTLRRGILDTVPRAWPAGTPIWFVSTAATVWDFTNRSAFEDVEFKVLPLAVGGSLDINDAVLRNFELSERPHAPFRPANVRLEGTAFGTYVALDREAKSVTWANRYRQGEDAVILAWDAGTVAPEAGQTTEIDVLRASDRAVVSSFTGITGTSYSIPKTAWAGETDVIVKVFSARDGIRSIQGHEINMTLPPPPGYGTSYGTSWGG